MPYEGNLHLANERPKIVLKNKNEIIPTILTQLPKKDSLQIWYKPIKADSLSIEVNKDKYTESFNFKIKDQKKDSLSIVAKPNAILNFRDRFTLETATPLVNFDKTKIKILTKDLVDVPFTTEYDEFNQKLYLDFKKEPSEKYNFTLLPGALTDFYEKSNDTLRFKLETKSTAEYGNLNVTLENVKHFPVIVELTNAKGEVITSQYTESNPVITFSLLEPALFSLRAIYDENKNKTYDPGNFLEKKYAEEVIYFSKEIDVRANWDVEQPFDLSIPYIQEKKPKKKTEKKKANSRL